MQCDSLHQPATKAKPLVYGSVCSGIESATVAWHALGWQAAFFSEIDPFPRAVLQHHFPNTPLHGDFTTIKEDDYAAIDLLVGGTPCQAFSVAGLRKGFADERGNLTLEYVRLAQRLRPRWLVWENVPGVLSIDRGRAFGSFLGGLAELGYGFAYRVLDAQHFGVPQRRRRVFVVGHLGDWRPAATVLFESESLRRDITPRREAEKSVAALTANGVGTCGADDNQGQAGHLIASSVAPTLRAGGNRTGGDRPPGTDVDTCESLIASTLRSRSTSRGVDSACSDTLITHSLRADGFDASEDGTGRGTPLIPMIYRTNAAGQVDAQGDCAAALTTMTDPSTQFIAFSCKDYGADAGETSPTLRAMGHADSHANAGGQVAVAIPLQEVGKRTGVSTHDPRAGVGIGANGDPMFTLQARAQHGVAATTQQAMAVRRITVTEAERLQGFPDGYTDVPYRGKKAADGPRYKALGNSMAVPCMVWIGQRIQMVRDLQAEMAA